MSRAPRHPHRARAAFVALAAISAASFALATGPRDNPATPSFIVYPPSVTLEGARDTQRLIVLETDANGVTRDITAEVTFEPRGPAARITGNRVNPGSDGEAEIIVNRAGESVTVPVESAMASANAPLSFRLDVLPVLTAYGCNAGGCHGSARGQDGFRLSLFGFDPAGDHERITRELPGRRIDPAFPDDSLLLRKPAGTAPHTGGTLFDTDSPAYRTLRRWIAEGAAADQPGTASVSGLEISPPEVVAHGGGKDIPLVVRATYSDGTDRDVTDLAILRTNNEITAAIAERGTVRTGQPGEAFITASFDAFTVGTPFIVVPENRSFEYADPADTVMPSTYIDDLIETKLRKVRVNPSPLCSDEQFARRVHLDIAGVLPEPERLAAFAADPDPYKRARLVDELLARKEFAEIWVMQWAELLQIRSSNQVSEKAALLYFEWLRNAIADNVPIDEMVRQILTASGGTFANPPTNFYQGQNDTLVLAENAAQAFMGIRIQCAQCHNHPFDRWTQDDYYGFAAFFTQIGRKGAQDPRETIVFDSRSGDIRHPVSNQVMPPKFLGDPAPDLAGRDRREVLAGWLVSPDNPQFARSLANRVWAHFMGRGIVEPMDDFRVSNPPANGPLLDALAARLAEGGYDFKALVRDICTSRAYQRATTTNETNAADERNFARATPRRLRAEIILDAVCQATGVPEKFAGLPLGERAVRIADGATTNYFLTTFGRASRESVDACEVSLEPSLSQALHLLNGDTVSRKVNESPVLAAMLAENRPHAEIVTALYLRCLARSPTLVELETVLAEIEAAEPEQVLRDLFWALLNSREFVFNH